MELKDRVDQISATIDQLREAVADSREAADGRKSRQLVDSLFRTVHTFKAAAAAESLSDLSRTAHELENLLHSVRTGQVALDAELLRVCDETVVALRDGSQSSALGDLNDLTVRRQTNVDDLPPEFPSLKENEQYRAAAAMREGANLYVMSAEFEVVDFDERFRHLKEQLEITAEIISISTKLENDKIIFQIVYASRSEKLRVHSVLQQAVRAGQATATSLRKEIRFVIKSDELLLDKSVSGALTDALLHLVRNAVDHGIESRGKVILEAVMVTGEVSVSVSDDGRGIAAEDLPFLFQPGFSTARDLTEVSGRGVGLDAVKTAVEEVGGAVTVTSEPGKGSRFEIRIPNPSSDA